MVQYVRNGKSYTAEKIVQCDGYFIAFDVVCDNTHFTRILSRGTF